MTKKTNNQTAEQAFPPQNIQDMQGVQNTPNPNSWAPGQYPYQPQQTMKLPKQPMDPKKKKKIILWTSIGGAALLIGTIAAIALPALLRIDYAPAYAAAKELKPKIYDIYHSYDCNYIIKYVNSTSTSPKTYNEYIEKCENLYDTVIDQLIAKLENTAAVKKDKEIGAQFSKFKEEYTTLQSGDADTLAAKLALWQARHNYNVASDDLSYSSSSDAEFTTAANYLINSGNDTVKAYGEGWLEKSLAIAAAYRAYLAAPLKEKTQFYSEYNNLRNELSDWIAANKPDINNIAPLSFDDASKMNSEFSKLYELIAVTYQRNYNSGSGDCTEFLGDVYCE